MLLAIALGGGVTASPAQAQLARTFVSAQSGNDADDCRRATPCRTFQGAHDKTIDEGEIIVLDPGYYGPVSISKSISIVNDGVGEARIAVDGNAAAVIINAPATAAVNLRGITIEGYGFAGGSGIRFNTGLSLTVENCIIRRQRDLTLQIPAMTLPRRPRS